MEHLLKKRFLIELNNMGGLSDGRYGFVEGRSTIDAAEGALKYAKLANDGAWSRKDYCALIAIDVENAFNTLDWAKIIRQLKSKHVSDEMVEMIKSYLVNRKLELATSGRRISVGPPAVEFSIR